MESAPSSHVQVDLPSTLKYLDQVEVGASAVVSGVPADLAAELAREGLVPGARIFVGGRVLGDGPIIVLLGRARLALGRSICRSIEVIEP